MNSQMERHNRNSAQMTTVNPADTFMPIMGIDDILKRHGALAQFRSDVLKEGTDFGKIPGTGDKPTLLKPGAEKLCTLFGLSVRYEIVERIEDWSGKDHSDEPFFYYLYRCSLWRGEYFIAESDGSSNSRKSHNLRASLENGFGEIQDQLNDLLVDKPVRMVSFQDE